MGDILIMLTPFIIGINGVLLIALEVMDSIKRKKEANLTDEEKEREEIKERWKNI